MQRKGELGRIQFLRGAHYQDMEHWPPYWLGLPPMHYATHAVSPVLALAGMQAKAVHCFGSGVMRAELHEQYGNPYPDRDRHLRTWAGRSAAGRRGHAQPLPHRARLRGEL